MSNSKQSYGYQTLVNRPMPCSFCGATINGKIQEKLDPRTKEVIKERNKSAYQKRKEKLEKEKTENI